MVYLFLFILVAIARTPTIQGASVLGLMLSTSNRVASVQSEPGQQNLLLQLPLGRKRGLRQVRTWGVNKPSLLLFEFGCFFLCVSGLKLFLDVTCPFYLICDILVQSVESAGTVAQVVAESPDRSLKVEVHFEFSNHSSAGFGFFSH